jgi:hypothetical protein
MADIKDLIRKAAQQTGEDKGNVKIEVADTEVLKTNSSSGR